jgi:tetratricopeptide (TPR) repeat protein
MELFESRHYPGVVAMCSDALEGEPECVPLLVIRARAHIALRRDLDAQADLRDIIRLDPQCGIAYRLLGELAARRDENESAAIFFREAVRLDPDDREAADWLLVVDASIRPAAVAKKLPAPAAAAGRFPRAGSPSPRSVIREPDTDPMQTVEARPVRVARGTYPPADEQVEERPTKPFARGSQQNGEAWKTPAIALTPRKQVVTPAGAVRVLPLPAPALEVPTMQGRPPTQPPAKEAPRLAPSPSRPMIARSATPELPGFGEYLVTSGILTRERLRAAQAYQRSMRVQLSTAIVTLGLATPQRIEWAAVAHQSQLARENR